MPFATDEDIKRAHDILLKGKKPFDKARVKIIKEDSSCYVQASPGSGKTTALLAKLVILANRMPLPEGKGVCVLTHTNVAIDEIKAKLGQKADVLFRYPNFFGTIQTFLHKYVTSAALHYFYGSQIAYVDNDMANAVLLKKYGKLVFGNKLKNLIFARIASKTHDIDDNEIDAWGGIDTLVTANVIKKKGPKSTKYKFIIGRYDLKRIPRNVGTLIQLKKRHIIESLENGIILSSKVDWLNNQVIIDQRSIGIATEAGSEFLKLKEEMFAEGILSYDDAYDLAFRYIREKGLDFSSFSDKRFQYLFIDEVQDCNHQQVELINNLFSDNKVVVQRFGDYCQAIFDGDGTNVIENDKLKSDKVLYIHDSNRFGEKIAIPLRSLCIEDNRLLKGNEEIYSVKPIIITYENPQSVLPKYVELLKSISIPETDNLSVLEIANKERQEDSLHRINVKACGWVGRKGANDSKRYIESYFPQFERKKARTRIEGDYFNDFLLKSPNGTVKDYATAIIQGILKFLDLCEVKNGNRRYTKTSLLDFLTINDAETKEDFLSSVMKWVMHVVNSNSDEDICVIKEVIYQYMTEILLPLFEKEVTESANSFFLGFHEDNYNTLTERQGNIYHGNGIDIEVATVHAVKGETHASTLYLETFYDGQHESERLSAQFKGAAYAGKNKKDLMNLKVVYVGMSRPRYLLCAAIQKDRFERMDCSELREIWDVVEA